MIGWLFDRLENYLDWSLEDGRPVVFFMLGMLIWGTFFYIALFVCRTLEFFSEC